MVDGDVCIGWNCSDFSVLQKFRTLGIAASLRRAAKQAIDAGRAAFLYAHPNSNMQLIHERVGHSRIGGMFRYTKVLRSEDYLQRSAATRWLPKAASKTMDVVMAAGLHGSPGVHERLGTLPLGTVRASAGWFTREEEIDRAVAVLREIADEGVDRALRSMETQLGEVAGAT